ncbi:hypothetical protein D9758_016797 [Tetrapyrgos nigripes]|uniref:Uncharacterized protein n=1 Tax=Tetrapyrgos nigripes TaxID=182062 RepID=A0A8H5BGW0_9AGAR|nr:hypothetical protein D9758_016797 [Tetrapyrgos nigripes]
MNAETTRWILVCAAPEATLTSRTLHFRRRSSYLPPFPFYLLLYPFTRTDPKFLTSSMMDNKNTERVPICHRHLILWRGILPP